MPVLQRLTPAFRWNQGAARFVGSNGRFVAREAVKAASETVASQAIRDMEAAAAELNRSGNLAAFIARMRLNLQRATVANGVIAAGGVDQMNPQKWGRIGAELKTQYEYLEAFAERIRTGNLSPAQIAANAKQYGNAPRVAFERFQAQNVMEALGHDEVANELGPGEHGSCEGAGSCVEVSGEGFLSPDDPRWSYPGERLCRGQCHCVVKTRKGGNE